MTAFTFVNVQCTYALYQLIISLMVLPVMTKCRCYHARYYILLKKNVEVSGIWNEKFVELLIKKMMRLISFLKLHIINGKCYSRRCNANAMQIIRRNSLVLERCCCPVYYSQKTIDIILYKRRTKWMYSYYFVIHLIFKVHSLFLILQLLHQPPHEEHHQETILQKKVTTVYTYYLIHLIAI